LGRILDILNRPVTSRKADRITEAVLALAVGILLLAVSGVVVVATWHFGSTGGELLMQGCPLAGVGILVSGLGLTGLRRRRRRGGGAAAFGGSGEGKPPSDPTGVPVRPCGPEPKLEAAAARRLGDEDDG